MYGVSRTEGARRAGAYLHELLLTEYPYRWKAEAERRRVGEVNKSAVAKVLAGHIHHNPTAVRGSDLEPGQIKDTVHRALTGKGMSDETLRLLIAAFDISEKHETELWALLNGTARARVIIGSLLPRMNHELEPQSYETIQRQEFHHMGPDGQPSTHRTVQGIRSLIDGYDKHRYIFDMEEVMVTSVLGGTPGAPYKLHGSLWAVDIALKRVLNCGDKLPMEFVTSFHHHRPVENVFRYAAHQRVKDIFLRVEFAPERLPKCVWWTEWSDYRTPDIKIVRREPVTLDAEHSVSYHLDVLERAIVGFSWLF